MAWWEKGVNMSSAFWCVNSRESIWWTCGGWAAGNIGCNQQGTWGQSIRRASHGWHGSWPLWQPNLICTTRLGRLRYKRSICLHNHGTSCDTQRLSLRGILAPHFRALSIDLDPIRDIAPSMLLVWAHHSLSSDQYVVLVDPCCQPASCLVGSVCCWALTIYPLPLFFGSSGIAQEQHSQSLCKKLVLREWAHELLLMLRWRILQCSALLPNPIL